MANDTTTPDMAGDKPRKSERRYLTPMQTAEIIGLLREHWEDRGEAITYGKMRKVGAYKNGYTDERIAHEVQAPVQHIQSLRRRYFGFERVRPTAPNGNSSKRNQRVAACEAQLKTLAELAGGFLQRISEMEQKVSAALGEA